MLRFPRTWVEVDLGALSHNLALIRGSVGPDVKVALVAKADAYGHGLVPVSSFAVRHGADWVAVATVQEGVDLREAGVDAPVIVISPILAEEAEDAVFYGLRVLVEDAETASALGRAAVGQHTMAQVHLEVDTNLARFGCTPECAPELAKQILTLPGVELEGLTTHFANSSWDVTGTEDQIRTYLAVKDACAAEGITFKWIHLANSAGAVRYPASRGTLVRTGIGAYGIDPYNLFAGQERPVLTWRARVMVLRELPPNSPVSYAGTYRTRSFTTIATLGVGYGDGYPRALSNKGFVMINGQKAPIVGLVCMDQVLVDVTHIRGTKPGDIAELVGPAVPIQDMARLIETNPHEMTCRIMPRVPRHYLFPPNR